MGNAATNCKLTALKAYEFTYDKEYTQNGYGAGYGAGKWK